MPKLLICTMTGQQYYSAVQCKAVKDVRWLLTGILVSAEHSEVVSTDGRVLYHAPVEMGESPETLIFKPAKLPPRVASVEVYTFDEKHVLLIAGDQQHICERVPGQYPDWRRLLETTKPAPLNRIGLMADNLAKVARVFSKKAVEFNMPTANVAVVVSVPTDPSLGSMLVMPVKLK